MKAISTILALSIILTSLLIPGFSAFALDANDNSGTASATEEFPLNVEVQTDKTSYSSSATAKVTVEITNISDNVVNNISAISTFNDTNPTNGQSTLSVDNIVLDSRESFTYSYYITAKPAKLSFFPKIFLLIKLLFIGSLSAPEDRFNDGRNVTTEQLSVKFGSYHATDTVSVYYDYDIDIVNASTYDDFADATSELVKETLSSETFDVEEALNDEFYSCRIIAKYDDITEMNFKQFNPDTVVLDNTDGVSVLQFANRDLAENCINTLKSESNIEYVETDKLITLDSDSSSIFSGDSYNSDELHTWGKEQIGADKFANYLEKNEKFDRVTVAVVDTGIDLDHEFLDGRIMDNGYDFVNGDTDADDDNGHGTHVAGIIADCTAGLDVQIMPIKSLDASGRSYSLSVYNGINYAVNHNVDVINLSLGGGHSKFLDDAVQRAIDKDIVVCVAAGNGDAEGNPVDTKDVCPAHVSGAITVAAVDKDNNIASFSNYGSAVDVAAPGVAVVSSYKDGKYAINSGTSMATPHVSAVAAMLLLDNPEMSPAEVEEKLISCCIDLGENGRDDYYGYGRIDLYSTVPGYSVTFVTNGGSEIATKTVKSGETVYLEEPVKKYKVTLDANGGTVAQKTYELEVELEGWYLDPEFKTERIVKDGSFVVREDTVLYAKWNNPQMGSINQPEKRTGYKFEGWFDAGTKYESISVIEKDTTLKAKWSLNEITIIFNGNGGTVPQNQKKVMYGSKYGTLPVPQRENAQFNGWYTSATGGTKVTENTIMSVHSGSTNVYAHWLVKKTGTISSSSANSDGKKLNINWASTGFRYYYYGSAALSSGSGTSFSGEYMPTQGTWAATTGLASGGAVFEISNIDSIRSYIKGKGGTLSNVTVNAVRENGSHGMSSGTGGYMYAVSNRASNYGYGTQPNGTHIASTSNWYRGGTFTGSYSSLAVMNNFMGTGTSDYRSIMFYADSNQYSYAKISSITITFTYTYWMEE